MVRRLTYLLHRAWVHVVRTRGLVLALGLLVGLLRPAGSPQVDDGFPPPTQAPVPAHSRCAGVDAVPRSLGLLASDAEARFARAGLHLEPYTVVALVPDDNGACWDRRGRPISGLYDPASCEVRLCPGRVGLHGVLHELAHHYEAATDQSDVLEYLVDTFPRVEQASGHEHWGANATEWFADILAWGLGEGDRVSINGEFARLHMLNAPVLDVDVLEVWEMITGWNDTLHGVLRGV